jgi:hypothetical protein
VQQTSNQYHHHASAGLFHTVNHTSEPIPYRPYALTKIKL